MCTRPMRTVSGIKVEYIWQEAERIPKPSPDFHSDVDTVQYSEQHTIETQSVFSHLWVHQEGFSGKMAQIRLWRMSTKMRV